MHLVRRVDLYAAALQLRADRLDAFGVEDQDAAGLDRALLFLASPSRRWSLVFGPWSFRQADAGELPAGVGREVVAVARADVGFGRRAGAAPQDPLAAHEFRVVLPERTRGRPVAGIRPVGAPRPFPDVPEEP